MAERPRVLRVTPLGLVPYGEALALQRETREARLAGRAGDTLLLVEHPPTVTLGRRSVPGELVGGRQALAAMGVELFEIERGGKTTYHGPGQLVGYPIVSVRELGISVPRYVALLEQTLVDYLGGLGLQAGRRPGFPGVWVAGRKIGAIGVHLKRWVTMHGFALNLDPDLRHFDAIVPCGIEDAQVTSVAAELGRAPPMAEAYRGVAACFQRAFGYDAVEWAAEAPASSRPR
jgi:lipoate-protein ligase B